MLSASSRGNGECRKSNVIFLEACGAATSQRAESGGESSAGKTESVSHSTSVELPEVSSTEFYQISTLGTDNDDAVHGDRRDLLHAALALVAENLREESTLPANPADPEMVDADALREDIAVELPITHCAFRGCAHTFASRS